MSTLSSTLVRPQNSVSDSDSSAVADSNNTRILELTKSVYHAKERVKFMHLQAEVESLLQQLQTIKQQRQESPEQDASASQDTYDV
ncbi:MAG: hypothetical protein NVS2B14_11580 [Chamaesiphon sp.]